MRRTLPLHTLIVVVLLGAAGLMAAPAVRAQEATPASGEMSMEGLTFTLLGIAPGVSLPGAVDLQVARTGFEPGAGFPLVGTDPSSVLVIIESGTMTARVNEQAWHISRGAALEQVLASGEMQPDMSTVLEEVSLGTDATLQAGDVAYIPGNMTGEVRNTGDGPAAALVVLFAPSTPGEGLTEATPAS